MSEVFANGVIHPVYYKIKVANGKPQFRRAPFSVLKVQGQPLQMIMGIQSSVNDQAIARLAADQAEDQDMLRNDFAYESIEPIVLEENQLGDGSDNWIGMSKISNY
jgi:hypothetical protein